MLSTSKFRLVAWFALFFGGLCVSSKAEDTLEKVKRTKEMVIGVRPDGPPMGYLDASGNFAGFGVDIANAVGKKLGVKVTFVSSNSQTRIPLLTSGRIDAEFGTTTRTKEREEVVDFTIIYIWDTVVPLVRAGETKSIQDYVPPRRASTTQGNYAIALFKKAVPDGDVTVFPEYTDAVLALLGRKVDAVITTRYTAVEFVKKYPGQLDVGNAFFTDPQAIMVRENDSKWRKTLNWLLQELWAEGTFQKAFEMNYGYAPGFKLWSEQGLQPGIVK